MIDAGKVSLKVSANDRTFDQVLQLSAVLAMSLGEAGIGSVVKVEPIGFEPFTADSELHGLRWIQIEMNLSRSVELESLVKILEESGVPDHSHLTYTDKMHLAGHTLTRRPREQGSCLGRA